MQRNNLYVVHFCVEVYTMLNCHLTQTWIAAARAIVLARAVVTDEVADHTLVKVLVWIFSCSLLHVALDMYSGSESSCHCCQVKYICVLWQDTYNTAYEVDRKRALGIILSQSRQQDHEDAKVYISL